jgi:predicted dehydrogenase
MDPVRFGLVGYGFGGRWFHAPLLAAAAECQLLGVVTTSPERRALLAADHPGAVAFDSLEALAAAGAEAVAISTPADTHTALTEQALDLGLAVVCDKPFALDADAARRTVARAAELGRPLAPYQNRRWDSDFRTERFAPEPGPPASGGGTLRDFGSHLVDQALVLLGPVTAVYAEWRMRDDGLDDDVFVALTHRGGGRSHLAGSWSEGAPGLRFRVTGTAGSYVVDGPMDGQEDALLAGRTPGAPGWGAEPERRWGRLRRGDAAEVVPSERGAWDTFYPAFAAAVRGEGMVPVDPRDAVATATVLDAARRSATTGAVVRLP